MFVRIVFATLLLAMMHLPASAKDVVLTLDLSNGETRSISSAELRALPATSFATATIWTEGPVTFTGVELATLLDVAEVTSGTLKATAINDYSVEIPIEDAVSGGPIVAYARDGAPMSVRDKGPLWIVYPYDSDPDYQTEVIYSRSIWQLERISILP